METLERQGIAMLSGMMAMRGEDYSTLESIRRTGGVRLDEHWDENLAAAHMNAALASRLGISLVTFHAGFLPHDQTDAIREVMIDRVRHIADAFAAHGIVVALETGQETATTLLDVLQAMDHRNIGVNFDPANMILYGMGDPVASFDSLAGQVRQVHIKDAVLAKQPGEWGTEMRVGSGAVNWRALMDLVRTRTPHVNLLIERESRLEDERKMADIRAAHDLSRQLLGEASE
jgi:sugar phosphate isomerase/epimerase